MADDCVCLYGGCDEFDEPGFQVTVIRRARKEHRCKECREPMTPGTRYQVVSSKHDGEVFTIKTCLTCAEIRDTFYCDGYYFGCLWEDLTEQMFEPSGINSACLAKLTTVEAKQQLARRWWMWVEGGVPYGHGDQDEAQ